MLEFFATLHWGAVLQIIVIDILLGGDNAVVIALACRNLPAEQRTRGVLLGTLGAIVLRVALISFAVVLLFMQLALYDSCKMSAHILLDMLDFDAKPAFLEPPRLPVAAHLAVKAECMSTGAGTIPPPSATKA